MTTFSKVKASWVAPLAVTVLLGSVVLAVTQQDQGGEATQTMRGFNQLNGVKLRFTVRVVTR